MTVLEMLVAIVVVAIIAAIAIPIYTRFIQKSRTTAAIVYVQKIIKAEDAYRLYDPADRYTKDFSDLEGTGMITYDGTKPSRYTTGGYEFRIDAEMESGLPTWDVKAEPVGGGADDTWLYADHTGTIRCKVGSHANGSSPPCMD